MYINIVEINEIQYYANFYGFAIKRPNTNKICINLHSTEFNFFQLNKDNLDYYYLREVKWCIV